METPRPTEINPARIMQLAFGYAPPLMIECALRIGLTAAIDEAPRSAAELAGMLNVSERGVGILANALVGLELLTKDAEDRYGLTPGASQFLVQGKPTFFGGIFLHTSSQLLPLWMQLEKVVRSGQPAQAVDQEGAGSEFFAEFVEAIFPMSYAPAQALGRALGADGDMRVLDIAAGSGVWGIALAQMHPRATVTAVDWPHVLPVTRRVAARCGLADRFSYVAGDICEADFGTGYTVAALGHILHSEGEERSKRLLKRVFDALAPGGTIAIAEMVADEGRRSPAHALIFAVNMLVMTSKGDTYTFGEMSEWLRGAGFENPRLLDAPGPSPLILANRPRGA